MEAKLSEQSITAMYPYTSAWAAMDNMALKDKGEPLLTCSEGPITSQPIGL